MIVTKEFVQEKFAYFNSLIFNGRLPEIPVELCDATSFIGQYKSSIETDPQGKRQRSKERLRFSVAFNLTERELEDIVIHEMLHYFLAYHGLEDRTAHGPLFRALMKSVNDRHGRSVSITHRMSPSEINSVRSTKRSWHVIAVLRLASGATGLKVLPRVAPKIIDYYNFAANDRDVREVSLYLHDDPYFNQFPTSVARKCHLVSGEEVTAHLAKAHRLYVKEGRLVQNSRPTR